MKIEKEHLIGVVLGMIAVVILYAILKFWPSDTTNQNDEQVFGMPEINSQYEADIDDIRFVELQIEAVTIDMYRYLGWFPEEKSMLKEASLKAIHELELIKEYKEQLGLSGQLMGLKETSIAVIDRLIQIYNGIERKELKDIRESFAEFNDLNSRFTEQIEEVIKQNTPIGKLPEDFDPNQEKIKFAKNQHDSLVYLNAVELIKDQHFVKAYEDLINLKDKYNSTIFENCINLRISDCMLMAEPDELGKTIFDEENGLALLSEIIDSQRYSPVLYDAFYKWRTQTQAFLYGMSNMSEIPNLQYNLKRWQVIKTIKQYLKTNPEDSWANAQVSLLLGLSNIGRGGPFGNDNLNDWGMLYIK